MKKLLLFLTAIFIFSLTAHAYAAAIDEEGYDKPKPTKVIVRVLAHGAKSMTKGTGALVVIRDARTGKEFDRGVVEGNPGDDTALLWAGYPRILGNMGIINGEKGMLFTDPNAKKDEAAKKDETAKKGPDRPVPYDLRGTKDADELKPLIYEATEEVARFETVLNIAKPTQILVEVYGPLLPVHSMTNTMMSAWVFPGVDVKGEGIVVELRGLIVDALDSLREKQMKLDEAKDGILARFYMRMMDGSPIAAGGMYGIPWAAEGITVTTQAFYKGKLYYEDVTTADKIYKDVSKFITKTPLPKDLPEGDFKKEKVKIRILAAQPVQNNFGMDEVNVYLSK